MRLKLILFIIVLIIANTAKSQSDDGWFTSRISTSYIFDKNLHLNYDQIYNLENHLSFGTGIGIITESQPLINFNLDMRIRPFGHKKLMPAIWIKYGYIAATEKDSKGSMFFAPEIGLETGNHNKIKYTINFGFTNYKINSKKFSSYNIGIGILI